jgi:hypothetical protein
MHRIELPEGITKCYTVGDMVEYLSKFPVDKPLIIDDNGDTYEVPIGVWDENHEDKDVTSPVAIFI